MSDNNSNANPKAFVETCTAIVVFFGTLFTCFKLFNDKNAGIFVIICFVVCILILLFFAFCTKKGTGQKWVRTAAQAALGLVVVLSFAGFSGWQYSKTLSTKDVIILVADFEGPDPQSYRVTETIRKNLENATEPYTDTKVKLLGKVIKGTPDQGGRELAREEGKKRKAAIVI